MSLEEARSLRAEGQHERVQVLLVRLAGQSPDDATIQYEAACVHDYLGQEAKAIPYYLAALGGALAPSDRRSAYTGLGSTYRTLGRYLEAEAVLRKGLDEFPDAAEMKVFLAMTLYNLGSPRQAVQELLLVLAHTSGDAVVQRYARAIAFYAQDIERIWSE